MVEEFLQILARLPRSAGTGTDPAIDEAFDIIKARLREMLSRIRIISWQFLHLAAGQIRSLMMRLPT